jgi:hypothetical protein
MTVGGIRTNWRAAMNWLRLHIDGAQSVSPLSERRESSSNDHLLELIPAEEVWPRARMHSKETMLNSNPGEGSWVHIKITSSVLFLFSTFLEFPKKMALTRHRRSNLDLLQSRRLRSRNVPLTAPTQRLHIRRPQRGCTPNLGLPSQQPEAHCPDPGSLILRDEADHTQPSVVSSD